MGLFDRFRRPVNKTTLPDIRDNVKDSGSIRLPYGKSSRRKLRNLQDRRMKTLWKRKAMLMLRVMKDGRLRERARRLRKGGKPR